MSTNAKGTKGAVRAVLNGFELLALVAIIRDRYVASGLDNHAFARTVNDTPSERKEFRFDVTSGHISSTIAICRIEPNRTRKARTEDSAAYELILRIQALEDVVAKIKAQLLIK